MLVPDRTSWELRLLRSLRVLFFSALALWLNMPRAGAQSQPLSQRATRPPNVLLIVSDDHAWTDYGFMGHPHVRTPNIDALAQQSLCFPRGYVPSSLCCPSLASLLTGRYPHQHKITSNDPPLIPGVTGRDYHASPAYLQGRQRMNEHMQGVPTLPRLLSDHGYWTLQTGKWWQGHYQNGGFTHGMTRGDRHGDDGLAIGRQTLEPITSFLREAEQENKPWMIWYAPMMPHDPHTPPESYLQRTRPLAPSESIAKYWAMIEWFDATVGDVLREIDAHQATENTIVIYVADNGWIQDPDRPRYAPKSKQSPYDGGLRTPILVRWPGHIVPERSDALAQSIDIVPTVLEAAQIPTPEGLPGINLMSEKRRQSREDIFGACFTHNANDLDDPSKNLRWRWMIRDHWKLIVPNPAIELSGQPELYDLRSDPTETLNRIEAQPDRAHAMRDAIDAWWSIDSKP